MVKAHNFVKKMFFETRKNLTCVQIKKNDQNEHWASMKGGVFLFVVVRRGDRFFCGNMFQERRSRLRWKYLELGGPFGNLGLPSVGNATDLQKIQ